MKNKMLSFFMFTVLLLTSNISAQTGKDFSIKSISQLQDSINNILKSEHQASLMLAVISKDSIVFSGGFGFANVETKQKANNQTLFPMASITKTFTALAIMKLVKQGKLSLNDNLSTIAPEIIFANKWEKTNPVKNNSSFRTHIRF